MPIDAFSLKEIKRRLDLAAGVEGHYRTRQLTGRCPPWKQATVPCFHCASIVLNLKQIPKIQSAAFEGGKK